MATLERRVVPTRSCVFCRAGREKRELLRVVRTPDGAVHHDPTGRANGRGAYVCRDERCIAGATGRGALRRALGVEVPSELADQLLAAAGGGGTDGAQ
jgi:predicted RNA-binding protein YlxR (DUF448 family)